MTDRLVTLPATAQASEVSRLLDLHGAAIVSDFVDPAVLAAINRELDPHVAAAGPHATGSPLYDWFYGDQTVRLAGLCAKAPSFVEVLIDERALSVVDRELSGAGSSYQLNVAEFVQIGPGQQSQFVHRDDVNWIDVPRPAPQLLVIVLLALTNFRADNGATQVALGSHRWDRSRNAQVHELVAAEMRAGSVLYLRGDVVHAGGANLTRDEFRRGIVTSYCTGWLRPAENSFLNVPLEIARALPRRAQELLGYCAYDSTAREGGMLGLYEAGDPRRALRLREGQGRS